MTQDEDTTVYVSSKRGTRAVYHTQQDCQNHPENPSEWNQSTAEAWGLSECKECQGIQYRQGPGSGDSELVWVATNSSKAPEAYHTRDCGQLPGEDVRRRQPKTVAEARGLSECQHCRGEAMSSGEHGPQLAAKLKRIGEENDD